MIFTISTRITELTGGEERVQYGGFPLLPYSLTRQQWGLQAGEDVEGGAVGHGVLSVGGGEPWWLEPSQEMSEPAAACLQCGGWLGGGDADIWPCMAG